MSIYTKIIKTVTHKALKTGIISNQVIQVVFCIKNQVTDLEKYFLSDELWEGERGRVEAEAK